MLENINKITVNASQHNKATAADEELINLLKKSLLQTKYFM